MHKKSTPPYPQAHTNKLENSPSSQANEKTNSHEVTYILTTYIAMCMHLHVCVHSINVCPFVEILNYRHYIIECKVHVCRLRR